GFAEPCLAWQKQTLGFAQTHWGTLPQTPSIEHPNPSILEGLPRRLAGSKGYLLTTTRGLHSESVNSLMLLHFAFASFCPLTVDRHDTTIFNYFIFLLSA
ncbi:hypothetical protein, partial [Bacillus pseudomycoides]|uniref:hypothetical protein n=1 Tax=Bacillus pseudomycoides TaxID=64104 RepID=UPI001C557305